MNRLIVLTGPSGSGLSSAKYVFEESGFYIVENPPKDLITNLLDTFEKMSKKIHNFCLILNIADAKETIDIDVTRLSSLRLVHKNKYVI